MSNGFFHLWCLWPKYLEGKKHKPASNSAEMPFFFFFFFQQWVYNDLLQILRYSSSWKWRHYICQSRKNVISAIQKESCWDRVKVACFQRHFHHNVTEHVLRYNVQIRKGHTWKQTVMNKRRRRSDSLPVKSVRDAVVSATVSILWTWFYGSFSHLDRSSLSITMTQEKLLIFISF